MPTFPQFQRMKQATKLTQAQHDGNKCGAGTWRRRETKSRYATLLSGDQQSLKQAGQIKRMNMPEIESYHAAG